MTKVEHTKTHTIPYFYKYPDYFGSLQSKVSNIDVLVTDAELVLVESKPEEALLFSLKLGQLTTLHLSGVETPDNWFNGYELKYFKPILISRTEVIKDGDTYWDSELQMILTMTVEKQALDFQYKILALPEHFSPQQLQDIIVSKLKLKEGKCLLECEVWYKDLTGPHKALMITGQNEFNVIKLNPHITIYPVGTVTVNHKNYPKDLVEDYYKVVAELAELRKPVEEKMYTREEVSILLDKLFWWKHCNPTKEDKDFLKWFEQNVK